MNLEQELPPLVQEQSNQVAPQLIAPEMHPGNCPPSSRPKEACEELDSNYNHGQNQSIKFHMNPKNSKQSEAMRPSENVQFSKRF